MVILFGVRPLINTMPRIDFTSPHMPKNKAFDEQLEPLFQKAVKSAVEMANKGYSLGFCVKKACEQSGYPTKSHVDKEMRIRLGERFLEIRADAARSIHGKGKGSSSTVPYTARLAVKNEIKKSENHFNSI